VARGALPDGAYATADALLLRYRVGGKLLTLRATWPTDGVAAGEPKHLVAQLDVAEESLQQIERELKRAAPVRLVDGERWRGMMTRVLDGFAPAEVDRAAVISVEGRDMALWREGGTLRVAPLTEKPARVTIERAVGDEQFAQRASAVVDEALGSSAPSLVDIGGREADAYLFLDPARALSVYVVRPPAVPAGEGVRPVGFALRTAEAMLLESHVIAPLKSPVTTGYRLLWQTLNAGLALLPRPPALSSEAPPLAERGPMDLAAWEKQLDAMVSSKRSQGTLRFLIDGDEFFPRLIDAVQAARKSVWLRMYIFDRDDYAVSIADLLRRRSRDIDVRVLLDQLGTLIAGEMPPAGPMPPGFILPDSIVAYLRTDSSVKVVLSPNPFLTSDHGKTILVDGERAFVGGMNIGREYRYEWHDMMAEVSGPIVAPLREDFERRWAHAGWGDLALLAHMLRGGRKPPPAEAGMIELRPLYTRTGQFEILETQLAALRAAQRRVWIEQAYLSDDQVLTALIAARQRGVDVRVVLPGRSDSGFMNSANLVASRVLVAHGVRVYAYPGMTHVKAALYDGWACFGSANMDKLSLRVNQELDLATSDTGAVARLRERLFEADFARSRELTESGPVDWNVYVADFIAKQL